MKTRTNWKNRMLSALLALAMVLSVVPETLFPRAQAILFDATNADGSSKNVLTIDDDGSFSVVYEATAPANSGLGTSYFLLVPDISVIDSSSNTVSGLQAGGSQSSGDVLSFLKNTIGLTFADTDIDKVGRLIPTTTAGQNLLNSKLDGTKMKVSFTNDNAGLDALPSLSEIYAALKECYGEDGFYVRGNPTLIKDPATQLGDAGIPYVAILFSKQGDDAHWNQITGVYKATVVGKSDLVPKDYLYKVSSGTNFPVMNGSAPNLQFANEGYSGSVTNKGDGNATFVKLTASLYIISTTNEGTVVRPVDNTSSGSSGRLILCSTKGDTTTELKAGDTIEAGKEYFLAVAPTTTTGTFIATALMPVNGYAKVEYFDSTGSSENTRVAVIPVRIIGYNYAAAPSLSIMSGKMSGKKGELGVYPDKQSDPDRKDRHPVMTIGAGTGAITGPYRTTAQPTVVDQVVNGKTTTISGQWVNIKAKEYSTDDNLLLANEEDLILEIEPTEAGNELDPGSYVETLYYTYYKRLATGAVQNCTTRFTVYIEVEPPEVQQPTLSRYPGDPYNESDYIANSGDTSRTDPVFSYTTGSWGNITGVTLVATDGTEFDLKSTDYDLVDYNAENGTGTLKLKNSELDKLDLSKYSSVQVKATFGNPPAGRSEAEKEATMYISGSFPVTINVTSDVDNYSHGAITLRNGSTVIDVTTGSHTVTGTPASGIYSENHKYTGTDTKAGTTYTVYVGDVATTETVSVSDQEATINFRTVTVHAGTGAGKVGISGESAAAAVASASVAAPADKADKSLTLLVETAGLKDDDVRVYLYAEPDSTHGGNASWTYTGASGGANGNAQTITSKNVTAGNVDSVATASYGETGVKVNVNIDGSAANTWEVELWKAGGTSAYKTATVTSGAATFTGVDAETYTIYVKSAGWDNGSGGAKSTGETITAVAGVSTTETTLNFYTVQLGTYSNGTATVTYDKDGSNTASVTSTGKVILLGDTTVFTLAASPNTNYSFGWTATAPTGSGTSTTSVGTVTDSAKNPATWTLPTDYSGKGPITLAPNFARAGVGMTLTVNVDGTATNGLNVKLTSDAAGSTTVDTKATAGTAGDGTTPLGQVTFNGLTASTKYYATVTTNGYKGTYEFTTPANEDGTATMNYYTVTVANGTGSMNAATSATNVLTGNTVTLTSDPDKANGYGGNGSWTLNPNPATDASNSNIGAASTLAAGGNGLSSTLTVNGKVTATASYTPNKITINVYMNGAADTTTNRGIELRTSANDTTASTKITTGASAGGGNGDSKAEFTPVARNGTNDTSTYYIYVDGVYTGVTVDCAVGGTASKTLYFYQVMLDKVAEAATPTPGATVTVSYTKTSGGTAVVKTANDTAQQEVAVILANGSSAYNSFTFTATATKVNNKDFSWTAKDKSAGTGSSALDTWTDPAKNSSSWTWKDPDKCMSVGAIVLSPNYADNGNYSLTINVYKDDDKNLYTTAAASPIEVVLTKTGTTTTVKKTTTTGTVTFDDLNGTYTASVTGWVGTKTGVGTKDDQKDGVTLKYWTISFGANTGGSVASSTVAGATADATKVYIDGTSYSGTSKADAGYTAAGWDVSVKTDPTATASTTGTTTSGTGISGALKGTTSLTAKFTQNPITGDPADQTYTYGTAVSATPATFAISGSPTGNYTYDNITVTGLPPGLTLKFGGVDYAAGTTTYSGMASVTITGIPADITDTDLVVTFDVTGPTGAKATGKTFKIKVNPATPTFTVEENQTARPHYAGDSAPGAVTVTVSGPYYNGDPSDYDDDNWVTLTTSSTDPVLDLAYDKTVLTGVTGSCNVKVTGSVDTTDNGKKDLSRVWTKDSDSADVPMSGTGTVIVNVTRNDKDYPEMNGKTVELKKSGTVVTNGSGTLAPYIDTAGGATSPSKEMAELENVPTDGNAYNVFVDSTDVKLTVTVKTGDNIVNVKYYDYNFNEAKPAKATESVTGMPTDPTDPVLSGTKAPAPSSPSLTGYTFKGWTTTSGGSASSWTAINTISAKTTFYAVWEAVGVTLTDMTANGARGLTGIENVSGGQAGGGGGSAASDYTYEVTATLGKDGDANAHGITVTALNSDDDGYGFSVTGTPDVVGEVKFTIKATSKKNGESKTATLTVTVEQVYTVEYDDNGATLDPANNTLPTDPKKYTESGKTYGSTTTLKTITAADNSKPKWAGGARALNGWALTATGTPAGTFDISSAKANAAADGTITLYAIWAEGSLGFSAASLTAEYNMTKAQWDANYASASATCSDSSLDLSTLVTGGSGSYTFTVPDLPSWMEFDNDHTISMKSDGTRVGAVKSGGYKVTINLVDTGLDNAKSSTTVTINVLKTTPVIIDLADKGGTHYAGDSTMDAMTYTEVQDPYDSDKKLSSDRDTDIGRWSVDDTTFDAGTKTYKYTYSHDKANDSDKGNYNDATGDLEMEAVERSIGIVTGTSGDESNFAAAYEDSTKFTTTQTYNPATNQITVTVGITNKDDSNSPIEKFSVTSTDAAAPFGAASLISTAVGTGGKLTTALDEGDSLNVFTFTVDLGQTAVGEYSVTFNLTAEAGFKADGTQLPSHKSATATYTYKLKIVPKLLDHATIAGLVAPVTNATPTALAALSKTDSNSDFYKITSITWAANDTKFAAGKKYTATILLTANDNYLFTVPKSLDGGEDGSSCAGYAVTIGSDTDTATTTGATTNYGTLKYDPSMTAGVGNAQGTVKLIYEFNPTAAGGPVPVLTEKTFSTADLVSITADSSEKMDFYYLINTTAPGATGAPDAAAVLAAGKAAADQFAGKVTSGEPSSGKVTWTGSPITLTDLEPGTTYYAHVVAVPTGKETPLSPVGTDSAELPKKLTVSISAADGNTLTSTTPKVTVSDVNILTGTTAVTNLDKDKTASGDLSVVKTTTAGKFDPSPNVPSKELNDSSTWAIKSITIKESATLTGTPAEISGSPNTTDPYTYKQSDAAAVTVVEMVFRKRITKAVIDDAAESDGTVTLTVSSATIGGTAVTNTDLDDTDLALTYAWEYQRPGTSTWTTISGETGRSLNYDPNDAAYAGAKFQVTVTYGKDADKTLDGDPSVVTTVYEAGKSKLETPEPALVKAEKGTASGATDAEKADGGLFLSFPPIREDDGTSNRVKEYEIILTKNGTQIGTALKFTAQDTTHMRDLDGDGEVDVYVYHWPADLTNIKPDDKFEVKVKAYAEDGSGYEDSDWGVDEEEDNIAGRKVLTLADWGVLEDRTFNGHSHRGTNPETANILKTTKANAAYAAGVGNIHVYYIDSEPDADPSTKADKKLHVNITEDGKNDYYVYVEVDKGALYLPLSYTKYTTDETWQIKQATPKMAATNPNPNGSTDTRTNIYPSPVVTYTTGDATGEGGNAIYNKGTITDYYEIVFTVTSAPAGSKWVGATPSVTDLQNFVADKQGTYSFKATAKYLDPDAEGVTLPTEADTKAKYEQFKADVGTCEATFTFSTQLRHVASIKLERYEAVNGDKGVTGVDVDIDGGNKNLTENRPVTYGTAVAAIEADGTAEDGVTPIYKRLGYYNADNNTNAKQMRMEGLKITVKWDTGDEDTYVVGRDPLPAGLFTWSVQASTPAVAPTEDDDYALTFTRAGQTTLFVSADGKTSTNGVLFKMDKRPLNWKVTSDEVRPWNNSAAVTGSHTVSNYLEGDTVNIALNGYSTRVSGTNANQDSNIGEDKTVRANVTGTTAQNNDVTGTHKGFYMRGTEDPGVATITPALVNRIQIEISEPSTERGENMITRPKVSITNEKGNEDVSGRHDESHVRPYHTNGTQNWTLPFQDKDVTCEHIRWEKLTRVTNDDGTTGYEWVELNPDVESDAVFQIDSYYRATVTVRADANHYISDVEMAARYPNSVDNKGETCVYTINSSKDGELSQEMPADIVQYSVTRVKVHKDDTDVGEEDVMPNDAAAPIFEPLDALHNNTATFSYVFSTYETPELQFSDHPGAVHPGEHHAPRRINHHDEDVTEGDVTEDIVYYITLNAKTKNVFGVQWEITNNELLNAGAKLETIQNVSRDRGVLRHLNNQNTEDNPDQPGPFEADKDLVIFKLTVPVALANTVGKYHLELQAQGASNLDYYTSNRWDVSKNNYTFTLIVREKQIEPPPPVIVSDGGGGGTTIIETPVVRYMVTSYGFTSDLTAEKLSKKGAKPSFVPQITPVSGLKFLGWSEENPATLKDGKLPTLVDPLTFSISEDKVFYAVYERVAVGHSHYVIGFPNGTFGPDNQITRGQVATIIARACLDNFVEGGAYGNPGNYTDVENHWAYSAISYCSLNGVFTGYDDGTFRPEQNITRQELATVVARLAGVQVNQGLPFSDSDDIASWALNGVYTNYANKWVNGYTDGSFKPLNDITRSETVKIFNGYLGRGTDKEGLSQLHEYVHEGVASNNTESSENNEYMTWPDVAKTHWAYYEIIEAANDHNFYWRDTTADTPPENWNEAFIDETWRYQDDANDGADNVGRGELPVLTVTYVVKSNGVTWDSVTEEVTMYSSPDPAKLPKAEPSEGYRFAGWSETDPDTGEISLIDPTEHPVLEDRTFYAIFEPDVYVMPKITITYVIGDHGSTDMELTEVIDMWQSPDPAKLPKITAHEGWRFAGWSETDPATGVITSTDPTDHPALEDSVFYAVYESTDPNYVPVPVVSTEPTEPPVEEPPVEEPPVEEPPVEEPPVEEPPVEEPPVEEPPVEEPPVEEPPVEEPPVEEPPVKHVRYSYINGYEDNTFHPDDEFTRATVAAIIANLRGYDPSVTYESAAFDDLDGHWAANSIAFCVSQGLMSGYTDNTFRPDNAISRQEFAVVLARVAGVTESGELPFIDADSIAPYARDSVYTAYAKGWIGGYDDGTFLPERNVTRAEAVKMINGFMGRAADPEYIENQSFYKVFDDVPETHWAYYEIIEATNTWNQ